MLPFFVYGTLLPGQANHYLWGNSIVKMETAVFPHGRLFDMGSYPMMVEQPGELVKGQLITVDSASYDSVIATLDTLEGYNPKQPTLSTYRRVERLVEVENGRSVTAWIYLGQPKYVKGLLPIYSGDWVAHFNTTLRQMNDWWTDINSIADLHEVENVKNRPNDS